MHKFLMPLSFRNGSSLPMRALPGPMDGITEGSFLKVLSEEGCAPAWFTPFLHISNGVPRTARLKLALQPFLASGRPVIAQIMRRNFTPSEPSAWTSTAPAPARPSSTPKAAASCSQIRSGSRRRFAK